MENNMQNESITNNGKQAKKKNNKWILGLIILVIMLLFLGVGIALKQKNNDLFGKQDNHEKSEVENNPYLSYRISGNSLQDFDLHFLQLENEKKNKVYSPLSIKYALAMLEEGTNGESKKQISNIIGDYRAKKYNNNQNMSFANALFVKDSYKTSIKSTYTNTLLTKYNAEILYDSFQTPDKFNSWVSDKTFHLIENMVGDISGEDFILVNALAIDMEWVNKIQSEHDDFTVKYPHEEYQQWISPLDGGDYATIDFKNLSHKAKSAQIGASINKYDIVNVLGEENIRATVGLKYEEYLASGETCFGPENEPDVNTYLDQYIKELNTGYKQIKSSTDFSFYVDDNVKVFAKDLKEYDGTTLQYVGIMPKNVSLDEYIKNSKAKDVNSIINKLKPIELESFKDGVITKISGYIPMFKFDYELNLMNDLRKLGVTDIFDSKKADLSNLATGNAVIGKAAHKANIEFSNDGIKAGAATAIFGRGASNCGFDYLYEVPVEEINLTFDSPYLFLIRDKDTKEVWFIGTVYEPMDYVSNLAW